MARKKKKNYRLRKSVRRTLGALFMISAIIIAAIPFPDAAAEDGSTDNNTDTTISDLEYSTTKDGSINQTATNGGINLDGSSFDKEYSYNVFMRNNQWIYQWQFEFYEAAKDVGIISDYNGEYQVNTITLGDTINTGYVTVSDTEYKNYYSNTGGGATPLTLTYDTNTDSNRAPFEKYFKDKLNTFDDLKTKYDTQKAAYDKWVTAGKPDPAVTEPDKNAVTVSACPNDLNPNTDERARYYCDYVLTDVDGSFFLSGLNFKMVSVDAYEKDKPYGVKYIPQAINKNEVTNLSGYSIDENGFIYPKSDACKLKGIGNSAFYDVTNVKTLTLPDNIQYIGDNAFESSFVESVSIANVEEIGNYAFRGCSQLKNLEILEQTKIIGTEAFAKTSVTNISFPYSVKKIGEGAFADNSSLTTIEFPQKSNDNVTICAFAFYNCENLGNVDLTDKESITSIGEGAFALSSAKVGADANCSKFSFPKNISDANNLGDYILAGRSRLVDVVMPQSLGNRSSTDSSVNTIPANTFKGCNSLGSLTFPDPDELGLCGYVEFPEDIFSDVTNPSFYVAGPAYNYLGKIASPRSCTWKCKSANDDSIPYVYKLNGENVYEVSTVDEVSGKSYLMSIDSAGILKSCNFTDSNEDGMIDVKDAFEIDKLTIPGKIAGMTVKGISEGCFKDAYKDFITYIKELVISDDGELTEIASGTFKGADSLTKVYIGNSVQKIGSEAFMDCPELIEIEFSYPLQGTTEIGANALSTGSDELTVIGKIEDGYGPFDWAMDSENFVNKTMGTRVCYKSGNPKNMTVILDNRNNYPTLVDYLHYSDLEDIPAQKGDGTETNLKAKYEDPNEQANLTAMENYIIESAFNVEIPAGIQSIDVRGFIRDSSLKTENANYASLGNSVNVAKYLNGIIDSNKFESYQTYGLFNGDYEGVVATPDGNIGDTIGNDFVENIIMNTVKYLPNNDVTSGDVLAENGLAGGAFYECDNLKTVILGSELEDIGSLPFLGCHNLNSVACDSLNDAGTKKYVCNNKIIYENLPDGSERIVECLGSRGFNQDGKVNTESDTDLINVSDIAEGAFSDCPELKTVSLRGNTLLTGIPDKTFFNDPLLRTVELPENIQNIGQKSFANCGAGLGVWIYGREVSMATDSFDDTQGATVYTYEDTAAYRTAVRLLGSENVEPIPEGYRVRFFDYDGITELIDVQYVEAGENAIPPEENPTRAGYIFAGWNKSYKNIMEDTDIIALYDIDPDNPGGTGSGGTGSGGTGTGGSNVNGGIDTDGDGIPDVDADGNKLYKLTVTNGEGSGYYPAGKTVTIKAGNAPGGTTFAYWSCSNQDLIFEDKTDWITTLTMIPSDITVICNFTGQYTLEVEYGSGSGSYPAGAKVAISAVEAPQGRRFASWVTKTSGLNIENSRKESTVITMPASNAKVTATYMDTGSISGNSTSSSKNNTSVIITKPGISDKDTASAYVSGSSDNFIVKISESLEAADEVQKALQKKYPDMSRIKYFAMDISLYDAKGINKITDTDGLKVNITMPIPDALREYAGNNRVGAVVNGELETLNPKFTTINGVPSITFTATHFSPYTIYVDTGNMTVTSTLDSTPKTGDGIHPKWFLSIGLACISIILFTKRDKRYITKAYR